MHKSNSIAITIATALTLSITGMLKLSFAEPVVIKAVDSTVVVAKDSVVQKVVVTKDSVVQTVAPAATPAAASTVAPSATIGDSAKAPAPAPAPPVEPTLIPTLVPGLASPPTGVSDTSKAVAPKKRKRIVRETTVNSLDEIKGRYRSPKKALFMSLLVPGLGQAYVGQHWANYTRAAFYLMTDVALAYGWRHYVVTKQDRQIAKYKVFADSNWKQSKYESFLSANLGVAADKARFEFVNAHRQSYCDAVQTNEGQTALMLNEGCKDPYSAEKYSAFRNEYNDENWSTDSTTLRRSQFVDPHAFYELIGKEVEFITGWRDAQNEKGLSVALRDSTFYLKDEAGNEVKINGKLAPATTNSQQSYISMRAKANEYARMQAYFLGGMIINHLVSALDAALTAHYHNKSLYQTDVQWWNRIRLDGGLAWQGIAPAPSVTAHLTF